MEFHKSDLQIIRDYVTAVDHLQYSQLPEDIVCILLTHSNIPTKHPDIRLNLHMTIEEVKDKFRTHIGTPVEYQRLILKRNGNPIGELSDNSRMLGFYSVESGMEIHVIDTDPYSLSRGGGLTDTSLIEKYKMSDEVYNQRKGTLREFIREQREKDPNYKLKPKSAPFSNVKATTNQENPDETPIDIPADIGPESVIGINIGDRCQVMPGKRRGSVQFIGEVPQLKEGYWVGVVFDEPCGLTNGVVKGVKYFQCDDNYGSFVRAKNMKVGDFPVRNILDDTDDEEDEDEGDKDEGGNGNGSINKEDDEDEI